MPRGTTCASTQRGRSSTWGRPEAGSLRPRQESKLPRLRSRVRRSGSSRWEARCGGVLQRGANQGAILQPAARQVRQSCSSSARSALAGSSCRRKTDHVHSIDDCEAQSVRSSGPYAAASTVPPAFHARAEHASGALAASAPRCLSECRQLTWSCSSSHETVCPSKAEVVRLRSICSSSADVLSCRKLLSGAESPTKPVLIRLTCVPCSSDWVVCVS